MDLDLLCSRCLGSIASLRCVHMKLIESTLCKEEEEEGWGAVSFEEARAKAYEDAKASRSHNSENRRSAVDDFPIVDVYSKLR